MQALKESVQVSLKRAGFYHRLRASRFYDLYWNLTDRRWIEARDREVDFYRNLLDGFRRGNLIFDVGANGGVKTDVFLRLGARVVAVEPDELNQKILKEKFLKLRLVPKPVVIIGKAVSDRVATETMWIDGAGSAVNTLNAKWVDTLKRDKIRFQHTHGALEFGCRRVVETTTLEELIVAYGVPFFIKVDVEGYELNVLRGLKRPVPLLSFEANLPEFTLETLECIELLTALTPEGKFNYAAEGHQKLMLETWLDAAAFSSQLRNGSLNTIEIFRKTFACSTR